MFDIIGIASKWLGRAARRTHQFFAAPRGKPELASAQYPAFQQQMPSHLRSVAIAVMATVNLAFVGFFALTGEATFVALAINMVLACAMLIILLCNYRDFNALVESRLVLQEEQAKAVALSNENFRLANLDSLTNLPNRRSFFSTLGERIERQQADGSRIVLGVLDLDGFKPINDTYGHPVGDALLRRLVDRLQHRGGDGLQVFRLGGDEFAILFASSDIAEARTVAESICVALREPVRLDACTVRISGTMGLAVYPDMASDGNALFERADHAMYRAKRSTGRGEVWLFTAEDEAQIKRCSVIETALRAADLEQELSVMFQPIVDINTHKAIGFEALACWNHAELGQVPPLEFIPIAERAGMIGTLTIVLLRKALTAAETWPEHLRLSFNLSVFDIASAESLMRITATIGQSRVSPARIDLEITETAMAKDIAAFMAAVATLKRIGVGVTLDDFGTGYTSLRQMHQLALDTLKIDRSLVRNVDQNQSSQKIIMSLVSLCNDLKLACIIEGVETPGEFDTVRGLGCQLAQGHYYSRPMAPQAIEEFLKLDHAGATHRLPIVERARSQAT